MKHITYNLEITGIVQGVGFRPFLYNLARNHDLRGVILNRGNAGVNLTLQGNREDLKEFIASENPHMLKIYNPSQLFATKQVSEPTSFNV